MRFNDYQNRTIEALTHMIQLEEKELNKIDYNMKCSSKESTKKYIDIKSLNNKDNCILIKPSISFVKKNYINSKNKENVQYLNWKVANKLFKLKQKQKQKVTSESQNKRNHIDSKKKNKKKQQKKSSSKKKEQKKTFYKLKQKSISNMNMPRPLIDINYIKTDQSVGIKSNISQQPIHTQDMYELVDSKYDLQKAIQQRLSNRHKISQKNKIYTFKPSLNHKSLEMAKRLGSPFQRLTKDISKSKLKDEGIQQTKRNYTSSINIKNLQSLKNNDRTRRQFFIEENQKQFKEDFKPQICQKSKSLIHNTMPVEERNKLWGYYKDKKIEQLKQQKEENEIRECTFNPKIIKCVVDDRQNIQKIKGIKSWLQTRAKDKIYPMNSAYKKSQRITVPRQFNLSYKDVSKKNKKIDDLELQQAILKLRKVILQLQI